MDTIDNAIAAVPRATQLALAGLGAVWLGSKALSLLHLFMSIFILSGASVSRRPK